MKHSLSLNEVFDDFKLHLEFELGRARTTRTTYMSRLHQWRDWLAVQEQPVTDTSAAFDITTLNAYKYSMTKHGLRPRSVRGAFNAIRALGTYLVETKYFETNPALGVRMPKKDTPTRLLITDGEIEDLFDACQRQAKKRDVAFSTALLATLAYTGARADELVNIRVSDVRFSDGELYINKGKGGKSRTLYPNTDFFVAVKTWITERSKLNCSHDFLWAHGPKTRMSYEWLLQHLEDIKAIAGYKDAPNIKPHSIRHWFATTLYKQTGNLLTVQAALGHSSPQTTYDYLHLDEQQARGMADLKMSRATKHADVSPNEIPITSNEQFRSRKQATDWDRRRHRIDRSRVRS
jgi:integrase/recombinase XerC